MKEQGKVAIVTGAGTGIGKSASLRLFEAGYRVVLSGRRRGPLEEVAAQAGSSADRTLVVPTDVGSPASVRALFDRCRERFGRLDLLFNNAGIGAPPKPLEDLSVEEWQAVVDTNLTGSFLCTQQAFAIMKNQTPRGGRIINNGSVSAQVPRPNSAPYTSTKHAITGLTRSTSLDGRKYDIACSQIDIGNAATPMTAKSRDGALQAHGAVVVEPTMDADHVARAVLYIAELPLDTNVQFMTVMATKMPYIGRG